MATNDWLEKANTGTFSELGATGLNRTGTRGLVDEEFLPELKGERGRKIYREMRENDPTIGGFILAIETLVRGVKWFVEGEDEQQVEFVESCMQDMSHTWEDLIAEILSMLPYGFSWHEVVYKRRNGLGNGDKSGSRYKDGKIGWRKIPIRSQDSLTEWVWDEEGGVQAFVQAPPPNYSTREIPIGRSLLFRTGLYKGNPEGRSILRSAYRPWYFKKLIENVEGIGIERDLTGLPVFYATKAVSDRFGNDLKTILRNIRRDEQEGLLLPLIIDPDTKQKELEFSLMSSPGQRQLNINETINRYDRRIAVTVLADFLLLGQDGKGSYALSSDKTALFTASLVSLLGAIASVFNRYAIPRLLAVNGWDITTPPELKHGKVDVPNLEALTAAISSLASAGMPLFPDEELENVIRDRMAWPKRPEDMDERILEQQRQAMEMTQASKVPSFEEVDAEAEVTPKEKTSPAKGKLKPRKTGGDGNNEEKID